MPRWKKPQPNAFERALSYLAPGLALKHYQARCQFSVGTFTATDKGRDDNRERNNLGGGADRHLDADTLWNCREICRDMERNSGISVALLDRITENVLGPNGYDLQPETGSDSLNERIEDDWLEHLETLDVTGEMHGWELFALGYRTTHRDGDVLWHWDRKANDFDGGLLLIEGDRCFTPWRLQMREGFSIRQGIVRRKGRKVSAWVASEVPADETYWRTSRSKGKFMREGTWDQWMRRQRPSTRGWPTMATVIREHDDLDDILLYERIALKLGAAQCYFIETENAVETRDALMTEGESVSTANGSRTVYQEDVDPGTINYLSKGSKPYILSSNRPGDNFDPFVRLINRNIGLPFGFPYELVTLDFSHVNFASSRQLLNQAWRHFRVEQVNLGRQVSKYYRWWLGRRFDRGVYRGGVARRAILKHSWGFPGWPSPNPVQDAQAAEIGILNGFESATNHNRSRGVAQDQIEKELRAEQSLRKEIAVDTGPVTQDEKTRMAARLAHLSEQAGDWMMSQMDAPVDVQEFLAAQKRAARLLRNGHSV